MAWAKALAGKTTAAGTSNPCRTSQARRAAFPPTARGSSPPRRCASTSSGTTHAGMVRDSVATGASVDRLEGAAVHLHLDLVSQGHRFADAVVHRHERGT